MCYVINVYLNESFDSSYNILTSHKDSNSQSKNYITLAT